MWPFNSKPKQQSPEIEYVKIGLDFEIVLQAFREKKKTNNERLGLCLAGGGAKGKWQVGFLAYLNQLGLLQEVNCITGTSVGGLNAVLTGRYINEFDTVIQLWRTINSNDAVFTGELPSGIWSGLKALWSIKGLSLVSNNPLYNILSKAVGTLKELAIPVYVVVNDYSNGSVRKIMGPGEFCLEMGMATSSVPGAFPAYNGKFTDGGTCDNVPYVELITHGNCTKVIVLYCNQDPETTPPKIDPPTVMTTAVGALNSLMNTQECLNHELIETEQELIKTRRELKLLKGEPLTNDEESIEFAQFYPSSDTGGFLDFNDRGLLQLGYDDAVKYCTIDKLKELLLT